MPPPPVDANDGELAPPTPVQSDQAVEGGQATPYLQKTSPPIPVQPPAPASGKEGPEGAPGLPEPPDVPIVPQVRKCTFAQFVNRFSPEEAGYAIEYLEGGTELGMEMAREVTRRRLAKVKGFEDPKTIEYKSRRFDGGLSSGTWLQAVRIQSQAVLKALAEVSDYNWGTEPHTFMRPFGHLIHFHPQIKEKLEALEAAASGAGVDDQASKDRETIEHLRCYISFVEQHLLPLVDQFADANYSSPKRIRHEDLWYLFKPGELIYMPRSTVVELLRSKGDFETFPENAIHQTLWRLEVFVPHEGDLERPMRGSSSSDWQPKVKIYFVDYDGTAYKPVVTQVVLEHFDGEKNIRNLEVFPIRFAPDSEKIIEDSRELGIKFTECIAQRHVSYKAWTLLNDPFGWRYKQQNKGRTVSSPEFIDGEVILDFQEAFNAHPTWKYSYGLRSETWNSDVLTSRDMFPILLWSDVSRSKLLSEWSHIVVSDDDIDFLVGKEFGKVHPYGQDGLDKPPHDDLVLLPRRLYGYGLRERRFLFLDVKHVDLNRGQFDAFRFLQIDPENKRIIHCLLTDHFNTKQARKTREIPSQDPIPGKGHNLVFLLHGPPGVGKTATVEAVAQKYQRPLFAITSGDLGSTPDAVESSLTEIFHLANVWNCILLLDEADVFLEERQKSDLQRNAVVSVFLRVMEYYNGVLFLTTNRPGQLDEAIKSRVHSALLYQTLTLAQTKEIFRLNIERLEMIEKRRGAGLDPLDGFLQADTRGILAFAEKHWQQHEFQELGRWNGRQIRNAFISAAALARGEADDSGHEGRPAVTVLTERHFQGVAKSVTAFDKYMAKARGGLDSERAGHRSDRPDDFSLGDDADPPRRYRSSRSPGLARSVSSAVGGGGGGVPQTPTPVRHYAQHAPLSPTPQYYLQPVQAQPPLSATGQQPFGGGYSYPVQSYGAGGGVPMPTVWPSQVPQVPQVQQAGLQAPAGHAQTPPRAQHYPGMVQQGAADQGMATRQGPATQLLPPGTPDGLGAQPGPPPG